MRSGCGAMIRFPGNTDSNGGQCSLEAEAIHNALEFVEERISVEAVLPAFIFTDFISTFEALQRAGRMAAKSRKFLACVDVSMQSVPAHGDLVGN